MSTDVPARGGRPRTRPGRPHPAVARRRRAVRRARRLDAGRIGVLALGGLACAALGFWLATGPALSVRGVGISGYDRPDLPQLDAALTAAAGRGSSLLSPPVGAIRRTAVRNPWVEDVVVHRDWPVGVTVEVIPARPAVMVVPARGGAVIASARGLVMGPAVDGSGRGLPRLRTAGEAPAAGAPLPRASRAPLTFVLALDPDVAGRVRGLHLERGEVVGRLAGGPELRLGPPVRMTAKAAALEALLARVSLPEQASATYIELSVPTRPALGTLTDEELRAAVPAPAATTATAPAAPTAPDPSAGAASPGEVTPAAAGSQDSTSLGG